MKKSKMFYFILSFLIIVFIFSSCGNEKNSGLSESNEITGSNDSSTDSESYPEDLLLYVVINVDKEDEKIVVESLNDGKKIVLEYSGGTSIQNKYGKEILIDKLYYGEIVEIEYKKGTQKLTQIRVSDQVWEYTQVSNFNIDSEVKSLKTGSQNYSYDENTIVFSNNLEISIEEINEKDVLTLKGYGTKILSILVTSGHGYVVIENAGDLVGGLIDIGSEIVTEIEENMVLVAPEGSYVLTVTKNGRGGSQEIVILRDTEIIVDIGKLQTPLEMGSVKFNIYPASANLYIDGQNTDYLSAISLSYGTHIFKITAAGYTTIYGQIKVNKSYTTKDFTLNTVETTETTETTSQTSTEGQQTIINTPEGASVYYDNIYMGEVPLSFDTDTGSHIIVLRKTGYESKSYTIYIADDGKDVEFDFNDLIEIQ